MTGVQWAEEEDKMADALRDPRQAGPRRRVEEGAVRKRRSIMVKQVEVE